MDKYLILVNESHPLGDDYIPEDLVDVMKMPPRHFYVFRSIQLDRQCFEAANRMFAQAEKDGLDAFILMSGYRTRDYQAGLYADSKSGKVAKLRYVNQDDDETQFGVDRLCDILDFLKEDVMVHQKF